ncbi:MAG: protein translocase subunit SecF [Gemmatimonadaceae bacterium]|nr:protein translocase subunit SecF [Gemmatimonadaceae bacterium]MCW5825065.1 protein translocase subunit SecF [Gemmatimonadaceae bacterium]
MFRILHNTSWDFVRQWKLALITVVVFVVPAIVLVPFSGFNYSIEFTGGTELRLLFTEAPNVADVRAAIAASPVGDAEITTFGSPNEIRIRAQDKSQVEQQEAGALTVAEQIEEALRERYGAEGFRRLASEGIGPRVGAELRRNAIIATVIAFALTLVYLAWRFEWRFGVAAVLGTLHDSLATLAFIKYLDIEISLFVVGGILTVIGYSMNDTVVVFDRIRENLRLNRKKPFRDIVNASINETLPRTVMTGVTTLGSLLALIILGGAVIRPFALILTFGIIVGTFSSIWVAAPLVLWIERKWPRETDATPHTRVPAARA